MRFALVLLALGLAGCATAPVAPYQRAYLARRDMALEAPAGTAKAMEKTYAAKEAALPGGTVGGGGCGCN